MPRFLIQFLEYGEWRTYGKSEESRRSINASWYEFLREGWEYYDCQAGRIIKIQQWAGKWMVREVVEYQEIKGD